LNTTVQTVSSTLASDVAAANTRIDNVLSNVDEVALNSLTEIVSAFQQADSDLNGAITALAGAASTNLASVSATLDSKIDSEVASLTTTIQTVSATLDSKIDSEVATLNTTVQSVSSQLASDLADEVARATAAEGALDTRVTEISSNYIDKRTGGSVTGNVAIAGEFEAGSGASTTFYVGDGVIGVNTESPSEAFTVVGSISATANLLGSGSSTIEGFVLDGGSF
jgi:hypothetical protein